MKAYFFILLSLISFSISAIEIDFSKGDKLNDDGSPTPVNNADYSAKEISISVPIYQGEVRWGAVIGGEEMRTTEGKIIKKKINGQDVTVTLGDERERFISVGIEGRKYFIGRFVEGYVRADYEVRTGEEQITNDSILDQEDHASVSGGVNMVLGRTIVLGVKTKRDMNNGDASVSLTIGARF